MYGREATVLADKVDQARGHFGVGVFGHGLISSRGGGSKKLIVFHRFDFSLSSSTDRYWSSQLFHPAPRALRLGHGRIRKPGNMGPR
jgi:hypothetical protein